MIIKNKRTREILDITYDEFRKKFANEIETAYESYRQTKLNKFPHNFEDNHAMEFNFYFTLRWNFNNYTNSNWYIERM